MKSPPVEQIKIAVFVFLTGILLAIGSQFVPLTPEIVPGWHPPVQSVSPQIYWHAYSASRVESLNESGRHVLVNYRANWHSLTVMHETFALETESVRHLLYSKQVVPVRVECSTMPDDEFHRILKTYDAGHIPLVVIHPADANCKPVVLEAPISESQVLAALNSL